MTTIQNQLSKRRLLLLLQLLFEKTDEDNPLSTSAIVAYFQTQGIITDRRTVKADIDLLIDMDYDIIVIKSTQSKFFIGTRPFEVPEVKLLIDAVYASKFITENKSKILLKKLSTLVSESQAKNIQKRLLISDRIKPINEAVYYSVDLINQAIEVSNQITFKYYEYTTTKKKVYKNKGKEYRFSPYSLIWNEDHYYVVGFSKKHDKVVSFRVDRMCNVMIDYAKAVSAPADFSMADYSKEIFNMFSGYDAIVTLQCDNELMKVIIDRFGENVNTQTTDGNHFITAVNVSVSPTFFGWIFQFAGKIKIISPQKILDEYRQIWKY